MKRILWRTGLAWLAGGLACAGSGPEAARDRPSGPADTPDAAGETVEPVTPPARDVVPYARLWARFTSPTRGFWPHEAWDAVFTVRDSSPETGYKPLPGEENAIRVDLQPWLGRAVPLRSVSWSWEGADPSGVEVRLAEGCGLPPSRTLDWPDPRLALDLGDSLAGCVEVRFLVASDCSVTALSVWTADPSIPWPDDAGPEAPGPPPHPRSGVIEGFYGLPWSWRERSRMVRAMAGLGLGAYLYAPKDDPLHRGRWREPYPEDAMDRFEFWNGEARTLGVTVFFGISPFIDFQDDDEDYRTLLNKSLQFAARGFTGFALLADDIEFEAAVQVHGALGASHAGLVNRLLGDLRAEVPVAQMWFVPTVYSDERLERWPGAPAYLAALQALDPAVEVLWTGPRTSCATMAGAGSEAEARAVEALEASSRNRFLFGPGSVAALLDEVHALPVEDRGFRPPTRAEVDPPACTAGTLASWRGWADATHVEVAGLPGAGVEAQGLVVWTPPHAGTFEAVAVALSDEGWDFQVLAWVCAGESAPRLVGEQAFQE